MRLLKLKIRNLASLKGEHEINFKEIQNVSPLFAITGETGAGKSTILNSIALVLYGKVYKTAINQADLVTLGEKDGEAQLIFQVRGKNYLAEWKAKIRNQRTGEYLKKPETIRYIYPIDGDDFDSQKGSPIESVENLLNLDFDQFCKCIILNQGEFARFLSSSFTERKEILEKLYPGEMLESLSRELKNDLDKSQRELNDLEIELETLKGDGGDGSQLIEKRDAVAQNLKTSESWVQRIESLNFHFVSLMDYHKKFQDNKKKSENLKLDVVRETTTYNRILKESQTLTDNYMNLQKEQERELPKLQEFLKSEESLKQWKENHHNLESRRLKMASDEENLVKRLELTKNKIEDLKAKKTDATKEMKHPVESLKTHKKTLDLVFDLAHSRELLIRESGEKDRTLKLHEDQGKALNLEAKALKEKIHLIPQDLTLQLKTLEDKKKQNQALIDSQFKNEVTHLELVSQIKLLKDEEISSKAQKLALEQNLTKLSDELLPIETTLKLQSLLSAVEVCLSHPDTLNSGVCPVCHTNVAAPVWKELQVSVGKNDFTSMKKRQDDLNRNLFKNQEELKLLNIREKVLTESLAKKSAEEAGLKKTLGQKVQPQEQINEEVARLQKQVWDLEALKKDETKILVDLQKARTQYSEARDHIQIVKSKLQTQDETLHAHQLELGTLLPDFETTTILKLKAEMKLLGLYLDIDSQYEKSLQEKTHLDALFTTLDADHKKVQFDLKDLSQKMTKLKDELFAGLKGKKASELIYEMDKKVKDLRDQWTLKEKETKHFELNLKGLQSSIQTLDEHLKEIDLQYSKELHEVRELGRADIPVTKPENSPLIKKLSEFALDTSSSAELFIPFKEFLALEKIFFRNESNTLRMEFSAIVTRHTDWERKQDRVSLLALKRKDLKTKLDRMDRLYDVLGKDELRTFVLSLVEENLILQTNDELQKLCSGRYEIVHQSRRMRMSPDFYILDKFREGGLRKVSTLSGGETFMVSVAMALALAEMTRGQAEIDTLFIDEGFGTLDQESLEDVLYMLQQIQTRGLMVGIISHIKALTQSLQVNLLVNKKSDGTSSLGLQYN